MGKLKGIIQFTGSFEGLSFYEMNGQIIVRKTGGFKGEKIKKDPKYGRVRENSSEFAENAKAGKYFRSSICDCLKKMQIPYVHNRVLTLFQDLSKLDLVSERGKRKVFIGLQNEDAFGIIDGFEFDKSTAFGSVFPFKYAANLNGGSLVISDFNTELVKKPVGTTHLNLQFIMVGLNFENSCAYKRSESDVLFDTAANSIELTCSVPEGRVVFGFLYVGFLQQINGEHYNLNSGILKIVGMRI
jgi:hypothetical protein